MLIIHPHIIDVKQTLGFPRTFTLTQRARRNTLPESIQSSLRPTTSTPPFRENRTIAKSTDPKTRTTADSTVPQHQVGNRGTRLSLSNTVGGTWGIVPGAALMEEMPSLLLG